MKSKSHLAVEEWGSGLEIWEDHLVWRVSGRAMWQRSLSFQVPTIPQVRKMTPHLYGSIFVPSLCIEVQPQFTLVHTHRDEPVWVIFVPNEDVGKDDEEDGAHAQAVGEHS